MDSARNFSDGAWAEYEADTVSSINNYLSGEAGGAFAAGYAYKYKDLVKAQAQHGRDQSSAIKALVTIYLQLEAVNQKRNGNAKLRQAADEMLDSTYDLVGGTLPREYAHQLGALEITRQANHLQEEAIRAEYDLLSCSKRRFTLFHCAAFVTISTGTGAQHMSYLV